MEDHETCSNCRRDIPAQNYSMHTLHCARNITLCTQCDEPVPRGEFEEHKEEVHGDRECPLCSEKIEACKLEDHQSSDCKERKTICKFCATHISVGSQDEHENYCGSRTEKCEECGEFVMLKNWELHINSNHGFLKLKDEPGPTPSWEQKSTAKTTSMTSSIASYSSSLAKVQSTAEPPPSTPAQRQNFTPTELFNNQDIYSSRRYSTTTPSSVYRSSSSSIVSSALNRSTSSSIITETERKARESTNGLSTSKSFSSAKTHTALANAHVNGQVSSSKHIAEVTESPEAVMIPCEFCEKMIQMQKLLSHQAECVNPSNVRGIGNRYSNSIREPSISRTSSFREPSVSRTSSFRTAREPSVSRSASMHAGSESTSMVSRFLKTKDSNGSAEVVSTSSSKNRSTVNGVTSTLSEKTASIVNRYMSSPEPKKTSYLPDSPPSYEKETNHYTGRPSYLREEASREKTKQVVKQVTKPTRVEQAAPGMYDNDADREQLRQMLAGMRRDPMEVADDPDNNDGSFFPCEFCGDPYPCEFLMRHQMSCDLNPKPVSSGDGFDYKSIKNSISRNLAINDTSIQSSVRETNADSRSAEPPREERPRLSRSNSTIERSSYSRTSGRAASVSRTSSFADRSYGTRTNLSSTSFAIADYTSAVRRSSVFDGYAGYSIYSSISEGLDQITYGGKLSRRNSITENNYSLSRRGSFSTRSDMPLPALMASLEASKTTTNGEERRSANAHVNGQTNNVLLQNGTHSHLTNGFSRQDSNDSPKAIDSPFGSINGHDLQRSESKVLRRKPSLKHSQSGYKLERKVSFHSHDQIIGVVEQGSVDENGQPDKPKRKKERTEEEKVAKKERKEKKEAKRAARAMSKDRKCASTEKAVTKDVNKGQPMGGGERQTLEQVRDKLENIQKDQIRREQSCGPDPQEVSLAPVPTSTLIPNMSQTKNNLSNTSGSTNLDSKQTPHQNGVHEVSNITKHNNSEHARKLSVKGPAPQPPKQKKEDPQIVNDLVNLNNDDQPAQAVCMREPSESKVSSSNRNSLDNKSVQTLAKDLAAECAKAYELMESSLSKLTNDFSVGPFGLTPKNKKKYRGPEAPPMK